MSFNLFIFHNDLTDSDNWVAALFLLLALLRSSSPVKVKFIVEPRQVALGLYSTPTQQSESAKLLEAVFGSKARKTLLKGLDSDEFHKLNDAPLLALRPEQGPKTDAELHCRLVALRFAIFLTELSGHNTRVEVDTESLDLTTNPVNLNVHDHEELVGLRKAELQGFVKAVYGPSRDKINNHRAWYSEVTARHEVIANEVGATATNLDFTALCRDIRDASKVQYFGGASATLLDRLAKQGLTGKMDCCIQMGTFDLGKNLFDNQFNIALCPSAANSVLESPKRFRKLIVVPSDSTLNVRYPLRELVMGNDEIARRLLAFNRRVDVMKLADEEPANIPDVSVVVPDLTALLCGYSTEILEVTYRRATIVDNKGQLTLQLVDDQSDGFPVAIVPPTTLKDVSKIPERIGIA